MRGSRVGDDLVGRLPLWAISVVFMLVCACVCVLVKLLVLRLGYHIYGRKTRLRGEGS